MIAALALSLVVGAAPRRVVSLVPSLTDVVLALGEGDRLVGVTRFDDDPRVSSLPRVGGYLDLDLEAVVRLRPDLVLAFDGAAEQPAIAALRRTGLRVLALRADSLSEVERAADVVAEALGRPEGARKLRDSLEGLREQVPPGGPVSVAVAVGWKPLVLAGRGSYLEPLIEAAGGRNVVTSSLAWPTSSVEELVARAPSVVIDGAPEERAAAPWTALLTARGARLVRLPDGGLFRPGLRAIRALPELAAALRGR